MTPLLALCAFDGRDKSVKLQLLLDAGADLHAVDNKGRGVWHHSANKSSAFIRHLKKLGADINLIDHEGNSPLHHVALSWGKYSIKPMIAAGGNPTLKNHEGKTPLDLIETDKNLNQGLIDIWSVWRIETARWKKKHLTPHLTENKKKSSRPMM